MYKDINQIDDKLNEECALFGASLKRKGAAGVTYNGLLSLQHRGQEGAGIATLSGHTICLYKGSGLVSEVFNETALEKLNGGTLAVGHTRYSTAGAKNAEENIQPFLAEYLTGRLAVAHNGNLTNSGVLRKNLEARGLDFKASSDSEVISSLIAYKTTLTRDVTEGVTQAVQELAGAFSLIILSSDNLLIAVRDKNGYRPLCLGVGEYGICASSESCGVESCGFRTLRDVQPGEIVVIRDGEIIKSFIYGERERDGFCIFEYVYFARPDSVLDGLSVYEARVNMGRILARERPAPADAVCGVPDSGLEAAMGYAESSGLPLVSGFVKNRYIGRSFIYPDQNAREFAVRLKLNPLRANLEGRKIVLVDDSIVRGTTCARIIKSLREAGAKEVHMRVSSPPFIHTCHYGTDIGDERNLIANGSTVEQIRLKIGADSLGYISGEGLRESCAKCKAGGFCTSCFDKQE
ncbi:MAG: amidophosphoribosyltransferase [Clostridiales bacterium]|jgi:amidophosphoribosyltransferase|nr:amidophosphoribosyltransferase [Clostridiales bacterium]